MGHSTDAIIFYGYHLPEDTEVPDEVHDLYGKEHPVLVGTHCSGEYPMYYVYIQETETTAYRGYPKQITANTFDAPHIEWYAKLRDFAQEYGIPFAGDEGEYGDDVSEVGWWLVSYEG